MNTQVTGRTCRATTVLLAMAWAAALLFGCGEMEQELDENEALVLQCEQDGGGEECQSLVSGENEEEVQVLTQELKSSRSRLKHAVVFETYWRQPISAMRDSGTVVQECGQNQLLAGVRGRKDGKGIRRLELICRTIQRTRTGNRTTAAAFKVSSNDSYRGRRAGTDKGSNNFNIVCPKGQVVRKAEAYRTGSRVQAIRLTCSTPRGIKDSFYSDFMGEGFTAWVGNRKGKYHRSGCGGSGRALIGFQSREYQDGIDTFALGCSYLAQRTLYDSKTGKIYYPALSERLTSAAKIYRKAIDKDKGWRQDVASRKWINNDTWSMVLTFRKNQRTLHLALTGHSDGLRWRATARKLWHEAPLGGGWYRRIAVDLVNKGLISSKVKFRNGRAVELQDRVGIGPIKGTSSLGDMLRMGKATKRIPYRYNGDDGAGVGQRLSLYDAGQNPLSSQHVSGQGVSLKVQQSSGSNDRDLCESPEKYNEENQKRYVEKCGQNIGKARRAALGMLIRHASFASAPVTRGAGIAGTVGLTAVEGDEQDLGHFFGTSQWSAAQKGSAKCRAKHGCDACKRSSHCQNDRGDDFLCTKDNICVPRAACGVTVSCKVDDNGGDEPVDPGGSNCVKKAGEACGSCRCTQTCGVSRRYTCKGNCPSCNSTCADACG